MKMMLKEYLVSHNAYLNVELMKINANNLKNYCAEVPQDESVLRTVAGMLMLLEENNGLGLAANQVGVMKRIIVINYSGFTQAIINPEITKAWGGMSVMQEGCLSFPAREATVFRHKKITVEGFDILWNPIQYKWKGNLARIAAHEIDHLDGITMFDREVKSMRMIQNG